jgi:hypothetical protein
MVRDDRRATPESPECRAMIVGVPAGERVEVARL